MSFVIAWHTLLEELENLPAGTTLTTTLSNNGFTVTDIQEHRVVIQYVDSGVSVPLQRDQFETLFRHIKRNQDGFALDRLPADADPYPAVLSVHPNFEVDDDEGVIVEINDSASTQQAGAGVESVGEEPSEPEGMEVYSDARLLIDALEHHDVTALSTLSTDTLVDLYTLLSDVQRDANKLRKSLASVLLTRVDSEDPVHGQFGSVQRTTRRKRSLKDDAEVLTILENAGVDRARVMSVDRKKVDEALAEATLPETAVYDIEETEYVRKAKVDQAGKESRLQGLKDSLATTEDEDAEGLRQEIEALERRIEDLTSFRTGTQVQR
jgi:hypothetical protein